MIKNIENYNSWNEVKKVVNSRQIDFYYKQQEIWWCRNGWNIGIESNGKGENFVRPVVIIKKHNTNSCMVVSLTNSTKRGEAYYEIDRMNFPGSVANLSQVRTVDSKRLVSKIGFLGEESFAKLKNRIREFNAL